VAAITVLASAAMPARVTTATMSALVRGL